MEATEPKNQTDVPETHLRLSSDVRMHLRQAVEGAGGADTYNLTANELVMMAAGLLLARTVNNGNW